MNNMMLKNQDLFGRQEQILKKELIKKEIVQISQNIQMNTTLVL